jgi:alkylation response protein AidB-like acyl-CoA dehydrogenase
MDFGLSEEQQLLEASLRRFLDAELPPPRVREVMAGERAHDATLWGELARLGVAGLLVPEEHGGSGLSLLDAAIAAESLGRAAAPVPFLGTAVMAPVALAAATPAQRAEWLPRIADGRLCVGVALCESFARYADAGVRREGDRLHGRAMFAVDAGAADAFLVAVGDELAWVERSAAGLEVGLLRGVDETRRSGELRFDATPVAAWVGGRGAADAAASLERALAAGRVALAADLLGAAGRCLERAVAWSLVREQFGRPIGSFQAVKHLCAEMAAEIEPARSLLWYAAHAFDAAPAEAPLLALHAKAHLAEVGSFVARTATEVHGGIGFTAECDLQLWFKRVGASRAMLGSPDALRENAAALHGWAPV